jgi:hypothetical protein
MAGGADARVFAQDYFGNPDSTQAIGPDHSHAAAADPLHQLLAQPPAVETALCSQAIATTSDFTAVAARPSMTGEDLGRRDGGRGQVNALRQDAKAADVRERPNARQR